MILPQDGFLFDQFTNNDWLEAVELWGRAHVAIGHKKSFSTLTGYIPFEKLQSAIAFFLGYSWVGEAHPGAERILRMYPSQHPYLPGHASYEIVSARPVKFVSRQVSPLVQSVDYAEYEMFEITVAYSQLPYRILGDDIVWCIADAGRPLISELARNSTLVGRAFVDPLELPGGQLQFDDPAVAKPRTFQGIRAFQRNQQSGITQYWWNVPFNWVANPSTGLMPKIANCIGKINNGELFLTWPSVIEGLPVAGEGYPAHTLRLDSAAFTNEEAYADPVAAFALGAGTLERRCDIKFDYVFTDPTNGVAPGSPQSLVRGHRLMPRDDGRWIPVIASKLGGVVVPEETNFDSMFEAWDA